MNKTLAPPTGPLLGERPGLPPAPHWFDTPARLLRLLWHDRRAGFAVATGVAVVSGLLVALAMPRGPVTGAQAVVLLVTGFAVGAVVGLVLRSRLALLLAPLAHGVAFELGRLGADGPTVDGLHPDSVIGLLVSLIGRLFYALVGLLPMALGAVYGAALARHQSTTVAPPARFRDRAWRYLRRGVAALATIAVVALAVGLALPASAPPILGPDGKALPGSVAELTKVRLGGHDQWIEIRGASVDKPVLLYLSGGPGQSDLPYSRVFFADLARDFVVVGWDQRGTGKSYPALDPATLTLDRAVGDTIELTDYLRARFDEQKIYVMGESWGTILGVLAVQRRPDLYHAFIGSGQMVSVRETDRRLYHDLLAYATGSGDDTLARQMQSFGEPPYDSFYGNAFVFQYYDRLYKPYTPPPAYVARGSASGIGPWGVLGSEYTLVEKVNVVRGLADTFAVIYPQIQAIDFRRDAARLQVPVYLLDGQAELAGRRDLALEWYARLDAPQKRVFSFESSAHAVAFEQFEAFHRIMTETILPETYPGR